MNRILELVQSGDFDPVEEFTGNKDKFLEVKTAFENISNNLPKEVCIHFILTKIVPTVFDKNVADDVRDEVLEVGLHVLQFVNIAILTTKEQEDVFDNIEKEYVRVTGELRDSNYPNWDKLWIFLIKLCGDRLHSKMGLANKLLRVVEVAFRNSTSIDHRLQAYDCWMELINNSSLNMQHMCSAKQIKLLVTPMKAKFSRTPTVIMKRCDTYVYLLEKLGDEATLCLKEFLEFCFGPFDEKNDVEKMKQGKGVSEVCNKSTLVLLEIIGHSHGDLDCLKSDDLNLYKPLITDVNFPSFAEILINSVIECCVLLIDWSQDVLKNSSIIKCLWRSVLQFVRNSSDDVKKKCYCQINNCLRRLLERSHYNEHLHTVLVNMVDLLIQDEMVERLKETVFDISMNSLHHFNDSCAFNFENVQNFIISCFDVENGSKFDKIASNSFRNSVKCENSILCEVWLKCKIAIVPDNISNYIWPVLCLQNFKNVDALKSKWTKLYTTECKSESIKVLIMQEFEKVFLENPLLSSNIVQFLELISSGEVNPTKEFVAKFMRLIELVLTLPNLSNDDVNKISSIVLTYCNQSQHIYKSENIDEALHKLCGCLEHLVTIHKAYPILTKLTEFLRSAQPKILANFSKRLMTLLEALMLNEDNSIANNTRKLIELLEIKTVEQETKSFASSRSLRIMNMANSTPKTRKSIGDTNSIKLSSSLKNTKPVSTPRGKSRLLDSKKAKDPVSINEDNSADYVKIDTEVKINVDNLNEHQKEVFKKRREDIPALYQELTQSQSQDFFQRIEKLDNKESKEKPGPEEPPKNELRKKSPSKKRRRSDADDDEHATKTRKISPKTKLVNESNANSKTESDLNDSIKKVLFPVDKEKTFDPDDSVTQISDEIDPDLRKMFDDVELEPVQKIPPEELFQDPSPEHKKVEAVPNKVLEDSGEESSKVDDAKNSGEKDQTQVSSELVQNDSEGSESNKSNDIISNSDEKNDVEGKLRVSPRSAKTKRTPERSPEKGLRKSKRNTVRKLREDLVNAVKKQLEQLEENETEGQNVTVTSEINESKIETEQINEEDVHENGEDLVNVSDTKDTNEEEKKENIQETSLRKSKRQIKKRHSEYMVTLEKKNENTKNVKEVQPTVTQSSEDYFVAKPKQKQEDVSKEDFNNSVNKSKKKQKRQSLPAATTKNNNVEDESFEDLLARIDKRIEESKKNEQPQINELDLPDGNDNEIIQLSEKMEEVTKGTEQDFRLKKGKTNLFPVKNEKKRFSLPVTLKSADPVIEDTPSISVSVTVDNPTETKTPEPVIDVYEFKADDESFVSEEAKKRKKRRKGLAFNRSDYISKRRKRPKKETKDEGFPFHVTADSPVPLSQSSSLRAVASETSETITIYITRSPPDSSKENQENHSDSSIISNTSSTSPKKKTKRKQSPSSEDLIESSQATPVLDSPKRKSPVKNKSRSFKQTTIEETMKLLDPPESHRRITRSSLQKDSESAETETLVFDIAPEVENKIKPLKISKARRFSLTEPCSQKVEVGKRQKRSRSLEKLDFTPEAITFSFEKPTEEDQEEEEEVHVNDTSVDTLTCDSIPSKEETPLDSEEIREADTLTLSPIRSPVKKDLPGSPITCDTPERTTELLSNTSDISPISSTSEVTTPVIKQATNEVSNRRVARLLQMVNSNVQVSNEGRRWFGNKFSSPSSGRIRKMRMKKEENLDILTFSREVPSPLTLPASGILKRKFNNLDETATPSPKRKRVNFSDPAITDKKLFIKDAEEYEIDQKAHSTNESPIDDEDLAEQIDNKKPKGFLGAFERDDALLSFRDFCDSNFKDISLNDSQVKNALKRLLKNLKVPEVVEIIAEYLSGMDSEAVDEIKSTLTDAGSSQRVVDQFVVPLIENVVQFEDFLPKLLKVIEALPNEQLQHFIDEVTAVFGDKRMSDSINAKLTQKQVEDHVLSLGCDQMNDLIKKYFSNLQDQRNDFLVDLMSLASNELPANKEFVNLHVNILQSFVKKMTD